MRRVRESSVVVRPEPVESTTYTPSSRLQAAGLAPAIALFEQAAEAVSLPAPAQPIVIADYGAATGHNSLLPISAAISVFRRRTRPDHAILIAHTDRPENDFTTLFDTVANDPDSYLLKDTSSFPSAVGRSFYSQILPSKTVTLGWTSWATMWLNRDPAELPEIRDHLLVAYSSDDTARSAYARQAAQDWQDFLAFRGRELAPDGRLVALTMAVGDDGEFGFRPLITAILEALREQVDAGLLGQEELRAMTIPIFARSEAELRDPFAPKGNFEGLSIEHLEVFDAEDRFWARYLVDKDNEAFGANWAAFARASIFPALAAALDRGPGDPRADDFVRRLEEAVAARLSDAPEPTRIPLASVVLAQHGRSH